MFPKPNTKKISHKYSFKIDMTRTWSYYKWIKMSCNKQRKDDTNFQLTFFFYVKNFYIGYIKCCYFNNVLSSCLNWMFCNMELHHWQFWLTLILKIQSLIQINVYCNAGVGKYRNVPLVPGLVVWKKLLVRTKYYLSWVFFTFNTCKHICWFMSVSVDFF